MAREVTVCCALKSVNLQPSQRNASGRAADRCGVSRPRVSFFLVSKQARTQQEHLTASGLLEKPALTRACALNRPT